MADETKQTNKEPKPVALRFEGTPLAEDYAVAQHYASKNPGNLHPGYVMSEAESALGTWATGALRQGLYPEAANYNRRYYGALPPEIQAKMRQTMQNDGYYNAAKQDFGKHLISQAAPMLPGGRALQIAMNGTPPPTAYAAGPLPVLRQAGPPTTLWDELGNIPMKRR